MINSFAQEHLQRLIANNKNGQLDDMIQHTQEAHDAYFNSITDEDFANSNQQGLSIKVHNLIVQFRAAIGQKEGIIKGLWGKGSPIYEEFFPHKKKEYWNATKTNIEKLMNIFISAAQRHVDVLGADFVHTFQLLSNEYKNTRSEQLTQIGKVNGLRSKMAESRHLLEIQLYKNLHQLAIFYPDNEEGGMVFFNQTHLRHRKKHIKEQKDKERQ